MKKMIPLISSQIPDYLNQGDVSIGRRQRESIAFYQNNI